MEGPSSWLKDQLARALTRQDDVAATEPFDLAEYTRQIEGWLNDELFGACKLRGELYFWLHGLAVLAAGVMPRLAAAIWKGLGHSGAISVAGAEAANCAETLLPLPQAIDQLTFVEALPASLRDETKSSA